MLILAAIIAIPVTCITPNATLHEGAAEQVSQLSPLHVNQSEKGAGAAKARADIEVADLILNPKVMVDIFGFAPAPLYVLSVKGYLNFFIGLILMIGFSVSLARVCPCCTSLPRFNAYTGKEVDGQYQELPLNLPADQEEEQAPREEHDCALQAGHLVIMRDGRKLRVHGISSQEFNARRLDIEVTDNVHVVMTHDESDDTVSGTKKTSNIVVFVSSRFREQCIAKKLKSEFLPITVLETATFEESMTMPLKTWADWELLAYLISQHSSAITLLVAMAQTAAMALCSESSRDRIASWAMFAIAAILAIPNILAIITIGGAGIWVYLSLPILLGVFALPVMVSIFDYTGMLQIAYLPHENDANKTLPEFDNRTGKDIRDTYTAKGCVGRTWFMLTYLIPRMHATRGMRHFLFAWFFYSALLMVPPCWMCISGIAALPVASAVFLQVIVPLFCLTVFCMWKLTYAQSSNINGSGNVMMFGFIFAQALVTFSSLLVPASILLKNTNINIQGALVTAYAKREGGLYFEAIAQTFATKLAKEVQMFATKLAKEEGQLHGHMSWAKYGVHSARIALNQLISLIA